MDLEKRTLKSYIFTGVKESCTGCGACTHICKHDALSMAADEDGFLFPVRSSDKCVNCGLCDLRCPEVTDQSNKQEEQHCYIGTTGVKAYFKESASIGLCTMLANYIVSIGGVVFGCFLDEEDWTAYHKGVSTLDGVSELRNSKYLQSNTKETYIEAKNTLEFGKKVLYIGTSCQIAGLKAFLRKSYNNLFTIDLFCHGVFSPKLMPFEIDYWSKKYDSSIRNFRFRSKREFVHLNGGMVNFDIEKDGKNVHIERFAASSPSYRCFAYSGDGYCYNLRLSCYNCKFKSSSRYADISVGDPWSVNERIIKDSKLKPTNCIRSVYSTNTLKGKELLKCVERYLHQQEYAYYDVFVQPAVQYGNRSVPSKRSELFRRIGHEDYGNLIESLFCCDLDKEHENFVRKYRKDEIKRLIKCIIGYNKWRDILRW